MSAVRRTCPIFVTRAAAPPSLVLALAFAFAFALAAALGACGDQAGPTDAAVDFDAPIDTPDPPFDASVCGSCTPDQICVQTFGGTCGELSIACEPRNPACTGNACSPGCQQWQCNDGTDPPFFRCDEGSPCPGEDPYALHCYGP
ncbi:MAG TPA: hypothetical protein VHE35_03950 [Kofleriaceae bacterium]|nr:hypothetical protein [Kofleriaceae bacterium]